MSLACRYTFPERIVGVPLFQNFLCDLGQIQPLVLAKFRTGHIIFEFTLYLSEKHLPTVTSKNRYFPLKTQINSSNPLLHALEFMQHRFNHLLSTIFAACWRIRLARSAQSGWVEKSCTTELIAPSLFSASCASFSKAEAMAMGSYPLRCRKPRLKSSAAYSCCCEKRAPVYRSASAPSCDPLNVPIAPPTAPNALRAAEVR